MDVGKALARYLRTEGVKVTEVSSPDKATRRRRGKTDAVDAEAAARAVLGGPATIAKAGDGPVEKARMFKLAKASAIKSRTQDINQLKSILVSTDPELRESLAGLGYKNRGAASRSRRPRPPPRPPPPSTRCDCSPGASRT
ncbi:IS110 family transposase [Micromonospora sp. CB01531]|uniref:IS110 family transposase n=1 Tax=Micromonospora sp. CB01531 TaxID=1718947 RepID=UPI000938B14C|nr:transposase [Micromonospora sp. CB01531]OKI44024.1 hypothetical protein A6A27_38715 [Micromonospora sp. CB01531]